MNLSIIISLLGTTIPDFNVFIVATIPNSNWWPGALPLDPTGGLTASPRPPNGLISPLQKFLDSPLFAPPYLILLATPLMEIIQLLVAIRGRSS